MLRAELDTMTRLHHMASRFVRDGDLPTLLSRAIDAETGDIAADMG